MTRASSQDRLRDLEARVASLSLRLTDRLDTSRTSGGGARDEEKEEEEPLTDQVARIARRVADLMAGRERMAAVAANLAAVEPLLEAACSEGGAAAQQLLLMHQASVREDSRHYETIKRLEPLLRENHLTSGGEVDVASLVTRVEEAGGRARRVRQATDALMRANADLTSCMRERVTQWDKRIRALEQQQQQRNLSHQRSS